MTAWRISGVSLAVQWNFSKPHWIFWCPRAPSFCASESCSSEMNGWQSWHRLTAVVGWGTINQFHSYHLLWIWKMQCGICLIIFYFFLKLFCQTILSVSECCLSVFKDYMDCEECVSCPICTKKCCNISQRGCHNGAFHVQVSFIIVSLSSSGT